MSDLLIRCTEMPTSCFYCPCYHHKVDDGYYDYEICGASGTIFNDGYSSVTGHKDHIDPFKVRLDNCPLVPVPPHGRLIDADEMKESIRRQAGLLKLMGGELSKLAETLEKGFLQEIDNASTIIPAEEGERWKKN